MSYCNKIKLCSFKAKKLRKLISKVFKVCKHKFYYLTPKDRRLNPQQTNRAQAWPIPSCLQKVPVNSFVH